MKIYVLCVDMWDGRHYQREVREAYVNKERAICAAQTLQRHNLKADAHYFVEMIEVVE